MEQSPSQWAAHQPATLQPQRPFVGDAAAPALTLQQQQEQLMWQQQVQQQQQQHLQQQQQHLLQEPPGEVLQPTLQMQPHIVGDATAPTVAFQQQQQQLQQQHQQQQQQQHQQQQQQQEQLPLEQQYQQQLQQHQFQQDVYQQQAVHQPLPQQFQQPPQQPALEAVHQPAPHHSQQMGQQQWHQQPQPGQHADFQPTPQQLPQAVHQPTMQPRSAPSPTQAAALIQRWYRGRLRRARFLTVINRARRRRSYLDQRRKVAQRLYFNEVEAEETKARLAQPGGARLVAARRDAQQADAAQRVQLLWRRTRAKRKLAALERRQQEEKAIRMLQRCARRWRERRRRGTMQSLMARALQHSPYGKPLSDERLLQHEQEILGKCRQFAASSRAGRSDEDWGKQAEAAYQEFTAEIGMQRSAVVRTLVQREQIKQIIQDALGEHRGHLRGRRGSKDPPMRGGRGGT
ncbi:unnamed protein product [Prorocentrum cordatum]|uniref:Uncharacterized protein n=1 Tax=Prorocentrum cordatum TaxID=2364126 RepID=A0ABN9P7Z2_9DINO|nr:unnamed protein product [Polarella glacialis]